MMIDTRELRIGNLVLMDGKEVGIISEIRSNHSKVIYQGEVNGNISTRFSLIEFIRLEPIPLTEEWLVRFGFEFTDWLGSWDLKDDTFGLVKTHNNTFVLENCSKSPEIKFVHSLQNIYFCLTNQELNEKNRE